MVVMLLKWQTMIYVAKLLRTLCISEYIWRLGNKQRWEDRWLGDTQSTYTSKREKIRAKWSRYWKGKFIFRSLTWKVHLHCLTDWLNRYIGWFIYNNVSQAAHHLYSAGFINGDWFVLKALTKLKGLDGLWTYSNLIRV